MRVERILNETIVGEKEVDFYVPVKIEFEGNDDKDRELFYCRMLNSKSSFVEMSINSETKKIASITLISVNDVEENSQIADKLCVIQEVGNPVIDMRAFVEGHIITDNVEFGVIRNDKKIYIIQESVVIHKRVYMDGVELLLDSQNNIIGFVFDSFSEIEWQEINESIDFSVKVE